MIYKLPFLNVMPEAEFRDCLYKYISIDDTFNSENDCKLETIDDQIVVFKKGKKIVAIDKDDQYITFEFGDDVDHLEIYPRFKEMIVMQIVSYYNLSSP